MSYELKEYAGGAIASTLSSGIASGDTSLALTIATNWPTGNPGPFYIVVDAGTSAEEKILATARTSLSVTGLTRGQDGTSAAAHAAGATVTHDFTATDAREANAAAHATLGTVTTKGDLTPATGAGATARLAAGADGLPIVAASGQTTGLQYAALTATGLASNAVTTAKITDANVTTAKIATGAVTSNEIADGTIVAGDIASGAITLAKFGTGLRPEFIVADATALAALTPAAGDIAYQTDTKAVYLYDGAAWVQQRRQNFFLAYSPSGSEDTATNATWPVGLHTSVAVPAWATRCDMEAKIGQVYAVTGVCNVSAQLLLGALTAADSVRIRWDNALVTSAQGRDLMLLGDVDCSSIAGTTVTARTLGNIVGGTGAVRANNESTCFIKGTFR